MVDMMMKREYTNPTIQVVKLQHRTTLLAGSVIGQGGDNKPSAAPEFEEMKDLLFGNQVE